MLFVSTIANLEINKPLGKGFAIRENCFLTNDFDVVTKLFPDGTKSAIGNMFWHELKSNPVIYWQVSGSEEERLLSAPNRVLGDWLIELITFFQALWLVDDHAVYPKLAYCIYEHPTHGMGSTWNCVAGPTTAMGMSPTFNSSIKKLLLARKHFATLIHYTFSEIWKEAEPACKYKLGAAKGVPRLFRFHYFLSGARHADDLAIKISLYMTCLEVLFSTGGADLTHKLSERVAYFLGKTLAERKSIFQIVKRAYAIRSKCVHGDVLSDSNEIEIQTISPEIDILLRRLMLKILKDERVEKVFVKDSKNLEEHLINLTLGCV